MPRPKFLWTLLFACTLSLPAAAAYACSCAPSPGAAESLAASAAVLEAVAVAGPDDADDGTVTYNFTVSRSWKGGPGPKLTISTAASGPACGRSYEIGTSYLLYLHKVEGNQASDNLCSRSRTSEWAGEDFTALGEGSPVAADDGSDKPKGAEAEGGEAAAEGGEAAAEGSEAAAEGGEAAAEGGEAAAAEGASDGAEASGGDSTAEAADGDSEPETEVDKDGCSLAGGSSPSLLLPLVALLAVRRRS